MRSLLLVLVFVLVSLTLSVPGAAAPAAMRMNRITRDETALDEQAENELRAIAPAAIHAWRDGDYEKVLQLAPGFTHAMRRLCSEEMAKGNAVHAIPLCRDACLKEPTAQNHAALAFALSSLSTSPQDLSNAELHSRRALELDPNLYQAHAALCGTAVRRNDRSMLRSCSATMVRLYEKEPFGYFFRAISAALDGDFDDADRELEHAHDLGLSEEAYLNTKNEFAASRPLMPIVLRWGGAVLAVWCAIFALLYGLGSLLSRYALASARQVRMGDGSAKGIEALLRRAYRVVLWLACAFYWISLPLVAVLVVFCAAAVVYAFCFVGRIPGQLVAIMAVVLLSTLVAIVRSLFIRQKRSDPGEALNLADHPRLAKVLRQVADRIGTRPVDRVYLTPFSELAVFEQGTVGQQLRGRRSERALILGAAVLDGMNVRAFKSILAHEYGHFRNEDTAGGGFALAVRKSLLTMALGLARSGAARMFNPAWLFVRGFDAVFLRISHGASRLQEVLADRWAAHAYGSDAFEEGLRHVVRATVAFDAHVNRTIHEVLERADENGVATLENIYRHTTETPPSPKEVDAAFDRVWEAEPSPYDSHPRPADRIAWLHALDADGPAPALKRSARTAAWDLFEDRMAIELRMTAVVRGRVETRHEWYAAA